MQRLSPKIFIISHLFLLFLCSTLSFAQTQNEQILDPASVSGKVLIEGKPAKNVSIGIFKSIGSWNAKPLSTAKTNSEGEYFIENIPNGSYYLRAEVPGFIISKNGDNFRIRNDGKLIVLEAGENLKNTDVELIRGSVITGRLTDASGKPIIGEQIRLETLDDEGNKSYARYDWGGGLGLTDDRGIYRFYGLSAGKYIVSYGINTKEAGINESSGVAKRSFYPLVFYPSVTSEKDAKIIALGIGDVAENVDIRMGEKDSTFKIAGKLINEETGKPFENQRIYAAVTPTERTSNSGFANSSIKIDGTFEINGFLPGEYVISLRFVPDRDSEYYTPQTVVKITDKDVENLEIKAKKGLSISGRVSLENRSTETLPVNLPSIGLITFGEQFRTKNFSFSKQTQLEEDGSFRFSGLTSGELSISPTNRISGLKIAKIEKDGLPIEKINISEGQSIKNLKVLMIYGTIKLQGEVRVENGEIPAVALIEITAEPTEQGRIDKTYARADGRGKFLLEGLSPGEYEVSVNLGDLNSGKFVVAKKRITLINGVNGQITLNVNLEQNPTQ